MIKMELPFVQDAINKEKMSENTCKECGRKISSRNYPQCGLCGKEVCRTKTGSVVVIKKPEGYGTTGSRTLSIFHPECWPKFEKKNKVEKSVAPGTNERERKA